MTKKYFDNYRLEIAYHYFFNKLKASEWVNIHEGLTITSGDNLPKRLFKPGPYPVYGGGGETGEFHSLFNIDYETIGIGRVGARCGCVFNVKKKSWVTDNALLVCENKTNLSNDFLRHYLTFSNFGQFANDSMQPVISKTRISDVKLPLLNSKEQSKIVEVLNSIESKRTFNYSENTGLQKQIKVIDNWEFLTEELDNQKELIIQLKQSILQDAIHGKLTQEWRKQNPDVEPATELLKIIQAEKAQLIKEKKIKKEKPLPPINENEIPFELPKGWTWCRIGDLAQLYTGDSINKELKESKYTNKEFEGLPYIGTKDVDFDMNGVNYNVNVKIPINEINSIFKVAPKGTVLICIEGGSSGKKIGLTNQDVCFGNKLLATVPYLKSFSKYFYYLFNSPFFKEEFVNQSKGLRGGVSLNSFKLIKFPIPPLEEQFIIVEKMEQLLEKCNALQNEVETMQQQSDLLLKALFNEIFEVSNN